MKEFMASLKQAMKANNSMISVVVDSTDGDDAALYETSPGTLLAATTDFGTPVSNNVATWGQISAENALSDIFAMGARPLLALSIMAVPESFGAEFMTQLTGGAMAALGKASTPLVGGHTVRSAVPFFGLSVVGQVPTNQAILLRNARPGQRLVVTKPLGTGIVIAAAKAGVAPPELVKTAEEVMLLSNRVTAEIATAHGVVAGTDVTGFGLIGHLQNMMTASGCSARLQVDAVPVIPGVTELLEEHGMVPNSAESNMFSLDEHIQWMAIPHAWRLVLNDPQTSGGLLLAVDLATTPGFIAACAANGIDAHVIGMVEDAEAGSVVVGLD